MQTKSQFLNRVLTWFLATGIFIFLLVRLDASDLNIEITHSWADHQLLLEKEWMKTTGPEEVSLTRVSYLLSEPRLVDHQGTEIVRRDWFAFVDAEEKDPAIRLDGLPKNRYKSFSFSIGLPESVNRSDPSNYSHQHPLNPLRNNLHWSWQGGYIFLALEGRYRVHDETFGLLYHIGNPPHLMRIELEVDWDLNSDSETTLNFDLQKVLGTIPSQHSSHGREGDEIAVQIKKRVENAFSVSSLRRKQTGRNLSTHDSKIRKTKAGIGTPYPFVVKKGFPLPALPRDFPLTQERIILGKKLFFDQGLSGDGSVSCASCHREKFAFADSRPFSLGIDSQKGSKNSMPLVNLAWKQNFTWSGTAKSIREQALKALRNPQEMGANEKELLKKISDEESYKQLFRNAFREASPTMDQIGVALEQFVISLTSMDSKFDRAVRGGDPLSQKEKRGFDLFFTEYDPRQKLYGADCFHCHGGPFFSDFRAHDNGLKKRPSDDPTQKISNYDSATITPSLRNIELTAPYMHDGRFESLDEVLKHYTSGIQRSPTLAPSLAKHGHHGIPIPEKDQQAIIAFLKTLTNPSLIKD